MMTCTLRKAKGEQKNHFVLVRRVGALAYPSRAKEDSVVKMRKGRFYLYTLTALLCVSMVKGKNVTTTTNTTSITTYHTIETDDNNTAVNGSSPEPSSSSSQATTIEPGPASGQSTNPTGKEDYETTPFNVTTSTRTTAGSVAVQAAKPDTSSPAAAIFIFIFIIIIIVILVVILFLLWKKGKRYSFDLTNPDHGTPLRSIEHSGIFEQTKESPAVLEYIQDESPNEGKPAANGCAGETPDLKSSSDSQNVPEENSFLSDSSPDLPVKKVEFNLDLDLISETQPANQDSPKLTNLDQNENNNNETNAEIDPLDLFTEINLDEPQ